MIEEHFGANGGSSGNKRRPTLEEYVKKHVLTNRSESTNIARRHRRTKTSQPNLVTQNRLKVSAELSQSYQPHIEIRNIQKDDNSRDLDALDINRHEHLLHKNALDFMPKYVIKQLSEKKTSNNGTTTITPYSAVFSAKAPNDINDSNSSNKDFSRRNLSKSTNKIQSLSVIQKQGASQAVLNLSVQSTPIISQQQMQTRAANNSKLTNHTSNETPAVTTSSTFQKINEEFLSSIAMASANNITANQQNTSTNLFSSAFVAMNSNGQLKSQYDKITTRANSGMMINSTRTTNSTQTNKK